MPSTTASRLSPLIRVLNKCDCKIVTIYHIDQTKRAFTMHSRPESVWSSQKTDYIPISALLSHTDSLVELAG